MIYENTCYVYATLLHNKHELDSWNDQFLGTVSSSFCSKMRFDESWELRVEISTFEYCHRYNNKYERKAKRKMGMEILVQQGGYSSKVAMKVVQVVSKRTVSTVKRRNQVSTWLNMQDDVFSIDVDKNEQEREYLLHLILKINSIQLLAPEHLVNNSDNECNKIWNNHKSLKHGIYVI